MREELTRRSNCTNAPSKERWHASCMLAKARPPSSHQRGLRLPLVSSPYPCEPTSFAATTMTGPSTTSFRTRAPPCLSLASQPGKGRSGPTPSLRQAHLGLASIETVCAWRLPSTTTLCEWIFCGSKGAEEKEKNNLFVGALVSLPKPVVLTEDVWTMQELRVAIGRLRSKKSPDQCGVPADVLQHVPEKK